MPHLKVRPQPHLADVSAPQARKHAAAAPASQKVPQAGSPGERRVARAQVCAHPCRRRVAAGAHSARSARVATRRPAVRDGADDVPRASRRRARAPLHSPRSAQALRQRAAPRGDARQREVADEAERRLNCSRRRISTAAAIPWRSAARRRRCRCRRRKRPAKDLSVEAAAPQTPQEATTELLTTLRPGAVATVPPPLDPNERTDSPTANEMMQKTLEAMRLEAQLARDMDAYQKLPKRRFIGAQREGIPLRALCRGLAPEGRADRQPQLSGGGAADPAVRQPVLSVSIRSRRQPRERRGQEIVGTARPRRGGGQDRAHVGAVRGISRGYPARHGHSHRRAHLDVHQGRRAHSN